MSVYYSVISAISIFGYFASRSERLGENKRKRYNGLTIAFLVMTAAILIFVGGLRYYVGTDYGAYYRGIEIYGSNLKTSLISLDEPGLPIIATVVSWFTTDGAYFVLICAAITYSLILVTQFKNTDCFVFATLLFIFVGNWHGAFNGVRQFLAAAIVFAGHRLILNKRFLKYALVVFIAFCVHRSAIIMIIPYFLYRNRITFRNVAILLIGTYILARNYDSIFSFIGLLKDAEMSMDDYAYYGRAVNVLRVMVACAPAVVCLILYSSKDISLEESFYINALLVNAVAMLAMSNSAYLARLGIYTNMVTPLALSKLLKFKNYSVELFIKFGVIFLYAIFWYIEVSGSGSLNNFRWIWER